VSFFLVTHTSRSKEEIETNSVDKVPEPTLINYSGPPIVKVIDLELFLTLSVIETCSGFNLGYGRTALGHFSNCANISLLQ
jgi:hypothetical protein